MGIDSKNANLWAMLCHLTALSIFLGLPFGNILVPIVIWMVQKGEFPFVDEHGKESVNFQISIIIYTVVAGLLCFLLVGFVLLSIILIADIVLVIMAAMKASNGESYRYPYCIRFLQ